MFQAHHFLQKKQFQGLLSSVQDPKKDDDIMIRQNENCNNIEFLLVGIKILN